MNGPLPQTLDAFFDEGTPLSRSLLVVNRTEPAPVQRLFEQAFEGQSVSVREQELPDGEENAVVLVEDGDVVATSPLESVMNSILLVNSDLYQHGTSGLDKYEAPDVITSLDETVFHLRGYPASNKEKLVLIVISRFIERRALQWGRGTLRTTFQRLSRIDDERGTRTVYERLAGTDLSVHVYGVPDRDPSIPGVTAHGGTSDEYRRSWCVVFRPPDDASVDGDDAPPIGFGDGDGDGDRDDDARGDDGSHAALVALETDANAWRGMWTYRPSLVRRIDAYLDRRF